jgi:small subunit ribosomal protein S12
MPTLRQLAIKGRGKKRRRCIVAALRGGPQRKAVVMKMGVTTPKKPNSAKRKYAKVGVLYSKKVVFAHPPGIGQTFIQEYSTVLLEGGNPPDVPGINYSLVRGVYDFSVPEKFGRKRRRSKFGMYKVPAFLTPKNEVIQLVKSEQNKRIRKVR